MAAFRKALAIAFAAAVALAVLSVRSDNEIRSGLSTAEHVASAECHGRSTACIEINYAYPAGDLSVVPPDVYF
jgi:hypothetical protein